MIPRVLSCCVVPAALLFMAACAFSQERAANAVSDVWTHAGETSVVVSCVTSAPAKACVEYGLTTSYGSRAAGDDKPRYVHIIRLAKLTPGQEVHCRIVATAPDGTEAKSDDLTLRPARIEAAVRIPADVTGPPSCWTSPTPPTS